MGKHGKSSSSYIELWLTVAFLAVGCAPTATQTEASAITATSSNLTLLASSSTVAFSQSITVTASGGTAPYTYSIEDGGSGLDGTINSQTGLYTAGTTNASVQLAVEDAGGLWAYATVTVGTGGSTTNNGLTVTPTGITLAIGGSQAMSATGGSGNYTYTLTGPGELQSGTYFATAAGTATITATDVDNTSLTGTATIIVTSSGSSSGLAVSPANPTVASGQSIVLTPSGGTPPYIFGIVSGGGAFSTTQVASGGSTTYTSPGNATGSIELSLQDSAGNITDFSVTLGSTVSSGPVSATWTMTIADYFGITFDNTGDYPSGSGYTSDTPMFWVWGSGSSANASGVGAEGSTANYIPLVNYSNASMPQSTYRGYFQVTTNTVSTYVNFCVPPAANNLNSAAAYVSQSGASAKQFFIQGNYNAPGEYIASGQLLDAFFVQVDTLSEAESATINFLGEFTSNSDCSDFNQDMFVEVIN